MDLSELRDQIITITGYPERGAKGTERINSAINYSLRQLWRDMPESLMKEEYRFSVEPNVSINKLDKHATDPLVFQVTTSPTGLGVASFATDGTLRARWLEIERSGKFYYRRIRDVFSKAGLGTPTPYTWYFVTDEPWDNLSDEDLTYKVVTKEYPYPADVQKIRRVTYDPENSSSRLMHDLLPDEMSQWRQSQGYRRETRPTRSTRGDFHSIPSPHYTPVTKPANAVGNYVALWGYNEGNDEKTNYGAGGTFSYRVMHVWGRRPFVGAKHGRPLTGATHTLEPFYRSPASVASSRASTVWGAAAIAITTPDIDYMHGYGQDVAKPSYHKYGVEKWIFRARHAVNTTVVSGSGTAHPQVEDDGIYYLWRIVEGDVTETIDRGDDDPVDKSLTLKDSHGHYHIRFDSYPTEAEDVLLSIIRRPETLKYDTDVSQVPPECLGALVDLTCSYLVGRRDGQPKRESYYFARYTEEVERLRSAYTFSGHTNPSFGEGLSASSVRGNYDHTVQES